jgi:beta-glucosidase
VVATVSVTYTGDRRGSTVVQLYVGDRQASVRRPLRELKAFAKVTLAPGETRQLDFDLPPRAFAFYDKSARCWRIEEGAFEVSVGFSAADLRQSATLELPGDTLPL